MRRIIRRTAFVALSMMMVNLVLPLAPATAAPNDNVLPGVPMNVWTGPAGWLGPPPFPADNYDVYWVQLQRDQQLSVTWRGTVSLNATMVLLTPTAASHTSPAVAGSVSNAGAQATLYYREAHGPGRYYLVVHRTGGSGAYTTGNVSITSATAPGKQATFPVVCGYLNPSLSQDWWTIWSEKGKSVSILLSDPPGTDDNFNIRLYTDDGTQQPNAIPKDTAAGTEDMTSVGMAPSDWGAGDHAPLHVRVYRVAGSGPYTLIWAVNPHPGWSGRISGASRFDVARELQIATRWPNDSHVSDIVVASGDDAAMADPLAAGGLCWAHNAPLLLVSKNAARNVGTLVRIQDIRGFSGKVRVHVVGGPLTIPPGVYDSLRVAAGGSAYIERISGANRFDLARNIALRMRDVRSDHKPGVLFANGADPEKFFDALAMSPVSASTGMPVLLLKQNAVPAETQQALAALGDASTTPRYLAGGPLTVSESVRTTLGATRWSGRDRYATAARIAEEACDAGYLFAGNVALAAKLPDALSAGADVGFLGGPVLVVKTDSLPSPARDFLHANRYVCERLWPVGGPLSIQNTVIDQAKAALQ